MEDDVQEYEEYVDEPVDNQQPRQPSGSQTAKQSQNVVSLQSVQKGAKVILLEPRTYEEAQEIADHLKNRKAVIINLQRLSRDQAKRVVDF